MSSSPPDHSLADDHGPVVHAISRVSRTNRTMIGALLRPLGLFPGQEVLMMQLFERDARPQTDLVRSLGLDPSTVTKMLQRMERAGWISRTQSPDDRRVVIITLTDSGHELRGDVERAWRELEDRTVAGLSVRQRDQLGSLLRRVEQNLSASLAALEDGFEADDAAVAGG